MELLGLISAFCIAVSFLFSPCASDQVNVQKPLRQYGNSGVPQAQFTLPRKLKLEEEAMGNDSADEGTISHRKLMEAPLGNKQDQKQENVIHDDHHHPKGTWREWVEGPNKSEYFTMDYAWVRRRRPIHNKEIPFVP